MHKKTYSFSSSISTSSTTVYFDADFRALKEIIVANRLIYLIDAEVYRYHSALLEGEAFILIPSGESYKNQSTVDTIIQQLIELEADRSCFLVGVGGGVATDITGFIASVFLRGVRFGFVPTTLLGMVDAAIGGKNGIDFGLYKNILGCFKQPEFILYDFQFLKTLPITEWVNGFAEIIKHSLIADSDMFASLQEHSLSYYKENAQELALLVERNAAIKLNIVQSDEFEQGERKLLNLGHTFGHAIERLYNLPHGHAVAVGMVYACKISENIFHFNSTEAIIQLLQQYQLPIKMAIDEQQVLNILKFDKKRIKETIQFVLLKSIGEACIYPITISLFEELIQLN